MRYNCRFAAWVTITFLIIVAFSAQGLLETASAQQPQSSWITVAPTTAASPLYTPAGINRTLSFSAVWTNGDQAGQPVQNATATIDVTLPDGEVFDVFETNTTDFAFNYTSQNANILTFNVTKLVTQDGLEFNYGALDQSAGILELQSQTVTGWWDAFHVEIVNADLKTLGSTGVTVNVTYLLIPEEGLTLPEGAAYSNETFLPKIAHEVNVTINRARAEETSVAGVYTGETQVWQPTAYVLVGVSREGWTTTYTAFSFAHEANQPVWIYSILIASAIVVGILLVKYGLLKNPKTALTKHKSYPAVGGAFLLAAAVISLYWGVTGWDGIIDGFDWSVMAALGVLSFCIGTAGAVMAFRKRNQAFAIFTVIVPLTVNVVVVMSQLEAYQLAVPWIVIIASLALSIVGGLLISNSDALFMKKSSDAPV